MKLFFIVAFCSFALLANAQQVTGRVVTQQNNPIANAVVQAKESTVLTDQFGYFQLNIDNEADKISIQKIGYERVLITLGELNDNQVIQLNESALNIEDVVITSTTQSLRIFSDIDVSLNPVQSSQEILRKVPGLFIGQHAGGGKAEQIFLRGFDIDHGTDISIEVDGMPVNMVSHAHGQGYSDMHFVLPESVDYVDFGKGPYNADKGNFATAGYVNLNTKERVNENVAKVEIGQFNTLRLANLTSLVNNDEQAAYVGAELLQTDSYFDSSQHFKRFNLMGKYTAWLNKNEKLNVQASYFDSNWDASGQIPQRAVDNGSIDRFGAIDDTEGGNTSRTNVSVKHSKKLANNKEVNTQVYYSNYDFELFSNFTFFLENAVDGDQIRQFENRNLFGLKTSLQEEIELSNSDLFYEIGVGIRNDFSNDNELSRTKNRTELLERLAYGDINESNASAFANIEWEKGKWLVNPSIRYDYFNFQYNDKITPEYDREQVTKGHLSPKFNLVYQANENVQLYSKSGIGFHSNDTRVVVPQDGTEILPSAYGTDLGTIWKPTPKTFVNIAGWFLKLDQEFVYVGDEAVVEPSGKTERKGIDLSVRQQINPWLFINADATYVDARSIDEPDGEDFIPLAPKFTFAGSVNAQFESGIYANWQYRYLGDRPANEDNSIVAEGYFMNDLNLGYKANRLGLGVTILNLFDTEWNETQFATESRLPSETTGVEEIHFTPGTPFQARAILSYQF